MITVTMREDLESFETIFANFSKARFHVIGDYGSNDDDGIGGNSRLSNSSSRG